MARIINGVAYSEDYEEITGQTIPGTGRRKAQTGAIPVVSSLTAEAATEPAAGADGAPSAR